MCGLVGIASSGNLVKKERDIFSDLLYIDTLRGEDSTGLFSINSSNGTNWLKHSVDGPTFLEMRKYSQAVDFTNNLRVLAGHNRKATKGRITPLNAHPFAHGDIILMHNGTVHNLSPLPYPMEDLETDSETICYNMAQVAPDRAEDIISKLDGAFALVWWDKRDNTINFCRNSLRDLHIGMTENCKTMVWASERGFIQAACGHPSIPLELEDIEKFTTMKHYKFSLAGSTIELVHQKPYKEYVPPKKFGSGTGNAKGGNSIFGKKQRTSGYLPGPTNRKSTGGSKDSSIPTKPKWLPDLGTQIPVIPMNFIPYPENSNYGYVEAFVMLPSSDPGKVDEYQEVEIHGRTKNVYDAWMSYTFAELKVLVTNVLWGFDKGNWRVFGKVIGYTKDADLSIPTSNKKEDDKDILELGRETVGGVTEYIPGMGNEMLTFKEFKELTKYGCMMCQKTLEVQDAPDIMWEHRDVPLCGDCAPKRLSQIIA